jgi:hypothetical protein
MKKAPGVRARKKGTKLQRGKAMQIVCYPRPKTKAVLVEASWKAKRSLSSFMVLASLKEAAAIQECEIKDLVPPDELQQYFRKRDSGPSNILRPSR